MQSRSLCLLFGASVRERGVSLWPPCLIKSFSEHLLGFSVESSKDMHQGHLQIPIGAQKMNKTITCHKQNDTYKPMSNQSMGDSEVTQKSKTLVCHMQKGGQQRHTHTSGSRESSTDRRKGRVLMIHFVLLSFTSCWCSV